MRFDDFSAMVGAANLTTKRCSVHHWQIHGGTKCPIVNVWPNSRKGFRFQCNAERARHGSIEDAIDLAGSRVLEMQVEASVCPPWIDRTRDRVGLIRRVWRFIW